MVTKERKSCLLYWVVTCGANYAKMSRDAVNRFKMDSDKFMHNRHHY